MPYRFRAREHVPQGVVRIVREQLGRAVKELTDAEMDRHDAVHQVRKRFKKVRAVLRLMRDELGEVYERENAFFRDTGRTLSLVRDAEAMIETVDRLRERFREEAEAAGAGAVRKALVERRRHVAEEEVGLEEQIAQLVKDLRAERRGVGRWPLEAEGFGALRKGLQKTYKRGHRALAVAAEHPTPVNLHEWRKRVKYHWYHARLLRCVWPSVMDAYRKSVHHLANLLGETHDLDVLRQILLDETDRFGPRTKLRPLLKLIERRRAELVAEAQPLGQRVFAEKPSDFCDRIGRYWEAWRGK